MWHLAYIKKSKKLFKKVLHFPRKYAILLLLHRGVVQLVERRSPKPHVAGSNPSAPAKKSSFFGTRIFLSKPQAWHIIDARSAVHIIKGGEPPLYLITRQRASPLRLDDIQCSALMIYRNKLRMIYNGSPLIYFAYATYH